MRAQALSRLLIVAVAGLISGAIVAHPASASAQAVEQQPAPAPGMTAEPEVSITPAQGLPDPAGADAAEEQRTGLTLRTTTRLVDVTLVAYDKKGRPVTDLKADDLEVYDNGRKAEIRFFNSAAESEPSPDNPGQEHQEDASRVFTNRPAFPGNPSPPGDATGSNSTILLIDAGNLSFADLSNARREILRFLASVAADERIGLYVLKSYGFQVLLEPTANHAQLASTLAAWMPSAQDLARAQDEEQRNRQQFDTVRSWTDLPYVNGNGQGGTDPEMYSSGQAAARLAAHPPDAKLRPLGNRPEDFALHLLTAVGRHLATLPGRKVLVWISTDNVLADFSGQNIGGEDTGSRFLDQVSLRARETLNEAHVSIYPLDVSQLETGGIGADIGDRNVNQVGQSDRHPTTASLGDSAPGMKPGRDTARMQEDTHPIQGTFRELAEATGGRTLRRAGDIAAELDNVVADGRAAYLLNFSPGQPADDQYHRITVKLASRRDLTLRYRTGYFYSSESASVKDRFRQAVWDARDASEIAVRATPVVDAKGVAVKLNIEAIDLALTQQDNRWTDRFDVFLALRDDTGLHSQVSGWSLRLRLTPATYQGVLKDGIPFDQPIDEKVNFDTARILVVDESSGRIGSVTVPATALGKKP
jgi:VWFA-related protein